MRIIPGPRVLLPLIVCISVVIIGLRVDDIWNDAAAGKFFTKPAHAEAPAAAPATPPATPPAAPAAASKTSPPGTDAPATASTPPATDTAKATPDISIPDDASPAEIEVLKQLSNRRQELDKRAQSLDAREGLIKVAEQRVDQKIKDMDVLRKQLQSMVNQASEAQAAQLDNLVKIYETMKPGDAAKIFEALDMPTLLSVVQRMKPARTAPIMAQMAPTKAKEITVALTKQDKLPQAK